MTSINVSPLGPYLSPPVPVYGQSANFSLNALFWETVCPASKPPPPLCPQHDLSLAWGKFAMELCEYFEGTFHLKITKENAWRYLDALDRINPRALSAPPKGVHVVSPTQLRTWIEEVQAGKIKKMQIAPITTAPSFLYLHVHPQIRWMEDGKAAILGQTSLPDEQLSIARAELEQILKAADFSGVRAELKKLSQEDSKGYRIDYPYDGHPISWLLGMNPKVLRNHQSALEYLFENLENSDFFSMSNHQIISLLQSTHELMLKELLPDAGKFRSTNGVVFRGTAEETWDRSPKGLREQLKKKGTTQDLKMFDESIALMKQKNWGRSELIEVMSKGQIAAWNKIVRVLPKYKTLSKEMDQFLTELKQNYQKMGEEGDIDFIALAAFVHRKIVEIHPFTDGNGRVARALMNCFLMQGGYQPIVFEDDAKYSAIVHSDYEKPGGFDLFLKKLLLAAHS